MSYDQYALIHAQQARDRQIADAADHRLAQRARRARRAASGSIRTPRRSPLRPVGQVLVRLGRALGAEPEATPLQPARSR